MQHQFKPGDLVLITGSVSPGSPNVGMAGEIIAMITSGQDFIRPDGSVGIAEFQAGIHHAWMVSGEGLSSHRKATKEWVKCGYSLQLDRHLMPLRDDYAPQSEKQKELTHE